IDVNDDFQIVNNSAASWMSTGELIAASWTDRWGSYHLWTWLTWLSISFIFIIYMPQNKPNDKEFQVTLKFFEILLWGGIIILLLLIGQRPYRAADAGSIPLGLNPSLLSTWNFLHPPLAFASYTGFFISWVIASYIWMYSPNMSNNFDKKLVVLDKIVTRITWVLTSLVLTLGMIWSHEANWGGYWSWDGVIVVSVILWLISGYRLHLHEVGSNQALYLFLGIIGFPLVFFAAWLITSNILDGLHNYAGAPIASLFLVLIVITMIPLVKGWMEHKWTPMSPVRVSRDIAKPTGFNLGVLSFNFLIVGNTIIIIAQIINSQFDLNRDFNTLYPTLNIIGISGITLGLLIDSLQDKASSISQNIGISIISLTFTYVFWIRYLETDTSALSLQIEKIIQTVLIMLLIITIFVLSVSEINKFSLNRKVAPRRLVSHVAMLLAFLTLVGNGAGPAIDTRISVDPFLVNIGDTVSPAEGFNVTLYSIDGPINNSRGQIVKVNLGVLHKNEWTNKTISVIDQRGYGSYIQATWITFPDGREIYFNLKRGQPLRMANTDIIGINLIVEQYFLTTSVWFSTILLAIIPFIPSKINSNK
ncbi:MAG: cytochrome c biogenesis protein CcsA, partial [Candidatus Kariarchaeaceae archaeon]